MGYSAVFQLIAQSVILESNQQLENLADPVQKLDLLVGSGI